MYIPSLTYRNNLLISAPKIHTDLLWDLSFLFIGIAVVYFIAVFFYRNRISKTSEKVKQRKRELSPMISEFLFLEEDATKDEKTNYVHLKIEIRQLLKDDFNRKVLSEILLDLRKDIAGEAQESLFKLYQDLGLHKEPFLKLKSWRWEVVSKGILELTQMQVDESYSFITKFINDKRSTIRKQAEIAVVTLRHEGINHFLDTTKFKISEWQQMKLLDVIRNKEDFLPPRFKAWLTSNNKHVVLFALRLIKYYNQNDANASLVELVKHKNNQIKEEAIACIKEFHVIEAMDTLKIVFWKCSTDVKIAILDAIASLGTEADIEFLKMIDKKEANFSVKSKALSSINTIAPESIMPSRGILDTSGYKIPEDIAEAVAKVHAEEHLKLSGDDLEEESTEPEITTTPQKVKEELEESMDSKPYEISIELHGEEHFELSEDALEEEAIETEIAPLPEQLEEEVKELMDSKAIEINAIEVYFEEVPTEKSWNHINEIEVVCEMEKGIDDAEMNQEDMIDLNFLPFVVDDGKISEEAHYTYADKTAGNEKKLLEIEVVFQEVTIESNTNGVEVQEEVQEQENSKFYQEFNMEELYFLPIVVDNDLESNMIEDEQVISDEIIAVEKLAVVFEEVIPELKHSSEQKLSAELEIPKTPSNSKENGSDNTQKNQVSVAVGYERYSEPGILNMAVIFEEVLATTEIAEILVNDIEVLEPKFIVVDHIIENEDETQSIATSNQSKIEETMTELEEKQLLEIVNELIDFENPEEIDEIIEEFQDWPSLDFEVAAELDFIPVVSEKELDELSIEIPKASIPKAVFGDIEFEASTRQLLNDLEEMGDQREIPLLRELLEHSKYEPFQERINELMKKFGVDGPKETSSEALKPFSVFQDLFRTCDTEAKLILLDEVVVVGDEKDIDFLYDLLEDDVPSIKNKAHKVLHALEEKLRRESAKPVAKVEKELTESSAGFDSLMEELEISTSDPSDIFDLNFEFSAELINENTTDIKTENESKTYGSFLGQICSFSHKILERFNG